MTSPTENALVLNDLAETNGDLARLSAAQTEALDRARLRLMHGDETAALAVESILDLRVTMPIYRLADAEKTIARLAKRAAKAGLPVPSIEEVSRETREDASEWITVRLLGAAPVLNGWTCVATVTEHRESGDASQTRLVVHTAAGADERAVHTLAGAASGRSLRCDHCNIKRRRTMTFVLRHADGRTVQVGKTCLNEYIGVEALATWFVWCELQEAAREYSGLGFDYARHAQWLADNATEAARRDKTPWKSPDLRTFLIAVAAEIRVNGYQKGGRFADSIGTGRIVLNRMKTAEHERPTNEDIATADGAITWLNALNTIPIDARPQYIAYLLDSVDRTFRMPKGGVIQQIANAIASAVPAYLRERGKAKTERLNEILPGVQPGETIEITLTVERSNSFAWVCADESGRCVLLRGYRERPAIGATIRVSGYVESMTIYNGTRQTILNNVQQIAAY